MTSATKTAKVTPPYLACPYDVPTISAVQALSRGDANPDQQKWALNFIINHAAATYGQSFHPDSERATSFAEGRRFVGLTLVKLLHLNPAVFLKGKSNA